MHWDLRKRLVESDAIGINNIEHKFYSFSKFQMGPGRSLTIFPFDGGNSLGPNFSNSHQSRFCIYTKLSCTFPHSENSSACCCRFLIKLSLLLSSICFCSFLSDPHNARTWNFPIRRIKIKKLHNPRDL